MRPTHIKNLVQLHISFPEILDPPLIEMFIQTSPTNPYIPLSKIVAHFLA